MAKTKAKVAPVLDEEKIYQARIYQCVNNGFSTKIGITYNKYYKLVLVSDKCIYIYELDDTFLGAWEIQKWQDFDDYFISKAEMRDRQINSIFEDDRDN